MERERKALLGGAVVVAVGAVVVTAVVWPDPEDDGGATPVAGRTSASASPTPSPTRSYPLSSPPRTIPAVRDFTPARGPGWQPDGGKVVVRDGELADEGRLVAGELGLTFGDDEKAGPGDVELALGGARGANAESYRMTVSDGRVRIVGPSDTGVFYGTRTLKQEVHGGGTAPEGVVDDEPAKPQRGFNLDIARKHFTVDWIKDRIREIGDLKYNQLGLHFSDDQSFRIESDSHPEIVSAEHLTKAQVQEILELAAERHVTVVPEIDSPGHLGAVIRAHPDLQLRDVGGVPTRGAVDISKPAAAQIVDDLLKEYAELFKGAYWHLGADEYQALTKTNPEASYPQLAAAARARYGSNARVKDLATGWLNDRVRTMQPFDRHLKAWNDGFFTGGVVEAHKDLEVAYWTGKEIGAREPATYLSAGRRMTNFNDEYLYYVLGQPNTFVYPTGQRIYESWTPLVLRGTTPVPAKYDDQILGGSFAVWCDIASAQTQDQVAQGVRMPLRATAQKLWDAEKPELSWSQFVELAAKLSG
ncbi:beta-N-acetylhexosaminidase [Streptomyces longispororuber]|uniref:beta-N-acetylhexosaminidase n=1 Tax=Streptomyces longispororuber TaxID=68230 RepID=UPI00210B2E55|nr:glycoside hydrolase family 20 protein [Streptomyces longispororuber]MCQ4209826.1 family 20 glycosylhydrolase [Streptomyces longispororuber]